MSITRARPFGQNYAFVVMAVIFLALLVASGQRAVPGVLILPLEKEFGWSRDQTSLVAALGIFLYGLTGPFAAALMQRFGVRKVLASALVLMTGATLLSSQVSEFWQMLVTWGVLSGVGTGCIGMVLGATMVNRWFVKHRGLMVGLLTASTATGTLIFLPALAAIAESGFRPVVLTVAAASALLIPLVLWLLPEKPADAGLVAYGATEPAPLPEKRPLLQLAFGTLARAAKTRTFWYLFGGFFICGFTTNGLIGTHLIALCGDMGIPEVRAASLLAMMGIFDLVGTTFSGWLTDRYDPRKLLFVYYALRGLSLIYLPYSDFSFYSLSIFAVFYGLDWIATVPPTIRLATESFGERDGPIVFGWIAAGHQLGAASAAFMGGALRSANGDYLMAFIIAGFTGLLAAVLSMMITRGRVAAAAA